MLELSLFEVNTSVVLLLYMIQIIISIVSKLSKIGKFDKFKNTCIFCCRKYVFQYNLYGMTYHPYI